MPLKLGFKKIEIDEILISNVWNGNNFVIWVKYEFSNKIHDVLTCHNASDPDNPKITLLNPGEGRKYIAKWKNIRKMELKAQEAKKREMQNKQNEFKAGFPTRLNQTGLKLI